MKRYRIPALLLCAALLLTTALAAGPSAAPPEEDTGLEARAAAEALHSLGLFQGIVAGRFDEESMALEREAARAEAMVMFVRLLGREYAVQGGYQHPFTDVPAWASPYVGYAYHFELVRGTGGTTFGSAVPITLSAYATFLLRALNYEEGTDFTWQTAAGKGLELGLYGEALMDRCMDGMTRGDLALVSYAALSQTMQGLDQTLAGYLVLLGLVDKEAALALNLPLEAGRAGDPEPSPTPETTPAPETTPTPEADPVPTAAPEDSTAYVQAVVDLVNEARAAEGVEPLVLDDNLTACAMIRAEELASRFEHTRPDGEAWITVLRENGYTYYSAGENIASGYRTPESVVNAWLNSPVHRANILRDSFGRIGVGIDGVRWVQLFSD